MPVKAGVVPVHSHTPFPQVLLRAGLGDVALSQGRHCPPLLGATGETVDTSSFHAQWAQHGDLHMVPGGQAEEPGLHKRFRN